MNVTGPGQSPRLLVDVVAVLNEHSIDYAAIGALAVAVHGVMRASLDADAVIAAAFPQLPIIRDALRNAGLTVELRHGGVDDPIAAMLVVTDRFKNRVELLVGIRGLDAAIYQRAVTVPIKGLHAELRIIGREDLIAMKLAAGSPRDLVDAEGCIAVAGETLDVELLRRLTKRFGRDAEANLKKSFP